MFDKDDTNTNSKIMAVDEEQLKILSGIMKKYTNDLNIVKKQADTIWEQCSSCLDDSIIENLKTVKEYNNKRFNSALEDLNNYANKMETIANIWKDAEAEIKVSSKKLETLFSDISRTMSEAANMMASNINKQ